MHSEEAWPDVGAEPRDFEVNDLLKIQEFMEFKDLVYVPS
jgi:hypothetical protein